MRRVVITGMGAITPLGDTVEELFRSQIQARSGVRPIERFDASTFPTTFAAEVLGFNLGRYVRAPQRWADAGEASQFAAAAHAFAASSPFPSSWDEIGYPSDPAVRPADVQGLSFEGAAASRLAM